MAAGYKPVRTVYKLNFSQTDHAGLEVTARGTTINGLRKFIHLGAELDGLDAEAMTPAELDKALPAMFEPFARVLVSWNVLDEDDKPVPATLDGLLDQEVGFVAEIIQAYVGAISQAPPPLPQNSGAGATPDPLEASIPMTSVKSSQPSS
jgi:hypothetical protein